MFKWGNTQTYGFILLLFFLGDGIFNITFPLYLVKLGFTYGEIGAFLSSFGLGMAVFNLIIGRHSDIVGRKVYIVISLFMSSIIIALFPLASTALHFVILLIIKGVARSAFIAVRAPFIREISQPEERGKAFGQISAFSTAGFAIGGAISGHIFSVDNPLVVFTFISALYCIAGIISVVGIPYFVKSMENGEVNSEHKIKLTKENIMRNLHKTIFHVPKIMWILCLLNFIQNAVTSPLWSLVLPIYLTTSIGISTIVMGYIYAADNALGIPASIVGGTIGDRYNSKKTFIVLLIMTFGFGIFMVFLKNQVLFIIDLLIFMVLFSISSPILERIESLSSRDDMSGFDLGLISVFVTLGSMTGQYLFGLLMDLYGERMGFVVVGIGYLLMAIISQISIPSDIYDNTKVKISEE